MKRKKILLKTAQFAKKHKLPINMIVAIFAVIILSCYLKDFVCKKVAFLLSPFLKLKKILYMVLGKLKSIIVRFYINNKRKIIKFECGICSVGILCLLLINNNVIEKAWGNENTGVYAEEPKKNDEETSINDDKNLNIDIKEDIPSDNGNTEIQGKTKYYIELNREMNTVTIYTYDDNGEYTVPVKAMRCATGGEDTPLGIFELSDKFKFAELLYNSYGQYCTRINGPILFHSSTYTALKKDTLSAEDYNLLGESVSHGCVRLTTEDAKWIYDNCDKGTVVKVYDAANPGPLGKPETIKVPEGTVWDPTDPDEENPWKDKKPIISGAEDRVLFEHDTFDVFEGIVAIDTCGNDVLNDVVIDGDVDIDIPGVYTVTYSITDALGRSDSVTIIITVR